MAFMGAAVILVGLLQPVTNVPPTTTVAAETTQATTQNVAETTTTKVEAAQVTPVKEVTAQDNPNNCNLDTQTVSETAPFNCVDKPAPKPAPTSTGGTCADWIAAAGITDVGNAQELIRRESGCNPYAVNPSSGACGVAQELPCGKSGCTLGDGYCQVRWMKTYVLGRYGSFANAVLFHDQHNWY